MMLCVAKDMLLLYVYNYKRIPFRSRIERQWPVIVIMELRTMISSI